MSGLPSPSVSTGLDSGSNGSEPALFSVSVASSELER